MDGVSLQEVRLEASYIATLQELRWAVWATMTMTDPAQQIKTTLPKPRRWESVDSKPSAAAVLGTVFQGRILATAEMDSGCFAL